jgi:uracil-DNA glycosylase
MFIGEQPGDLEDRSGHPFVGPAGTLFDQALAETDSALKCLRHQCRKAFQMVAGRARGNDVFTRSLGTPRWRLADHGSTRN